MVTTSGPSSVVQDYAGILFQIIVMLVLILAVFIVCWLPQMVSLLYAELRPDRYKQVSQVVPREPKPGVFYLNWRNISTCNKS